MPTFKMNNQSPEVESFFQNITGHVDRRQLNAECQQWALASGKCVDVNDFRLLDVLLFLLLRIVVKVLYNGASNRTRPMILMLSLIRSPFIHPRIPKKNTNEPVDCRMESTRWFIVWHLISP